MKLKQSRGKRPATSKRSYKPRVKKDSSLEKLVDRVAMWQNILRLCDWDIKVAWANQAMLGVGVAAHCESYLLRKTAYLRFLHPTCYEAIGMENEDLDATICHELLHLHINKLEPKEEYNVQMEQIVDQLANVIVKLYRRKA